jgi:hypothetical protein
LSFTGPQLDNLPGPRLEPLPGPVVIDVLQAEVAEEARAFLKIGHAVHDPFHTLDGHDGSLDPPA